MFLCCGDALYDLFITKDDAHTDSASAVVLAGDVGGSPMNVAVGLARLGHASGYFTKLSTDVFGQRMRQSLVANGIDIATSIETSKNTTLAIVETQLDGSADYVFYTDDTADVSIEPHEIPDVLDDNTRVLHFGSYTTAVDPTATSLATLAVRESKRRFISFDPNVRLSIEPDVDRWRDVFQTLSGAATLIKASDEDIETLFGKQQDEAFVAACFSQGAQLVFITRGAQGASGYVTGGDSVHLPGLPVDVIDTVGAGDTFQAAVLHWLAVAGQIDGNRIKQDVDLDGCMKFALRAASITCQRRGADLPRLQDIQSD